MIRNILWQVDGALFDTYPAITYAISQVLTELGLSLALNAIDGLVRQSVDHCFEFLSERFRVDPSLLRCQFAAAYESVPLASQPPRPGVDQVCALIHDRGGRNIAVTHRSILSTQGLLAAHRLAHFFDGIITAEESFPRQPASVMILAALEEHDLAPTETLLVGADEFDIQAGSAAGVRTCLFGQAPLSQPVDLQIDTYGQLLALLREDER